MSVKKLERLRSKEIERVDDYLAALAEAMAASISTISPKATWATISSVAGFSTPIRALEWGVTQAPPM